MKTDHLIFGAAYYLEYLPYDRLEQDMEMMEQAGINTIRIAESTWSTIEPADGIFDFTALDRMLEGAARHHISVMIGTPTYAIPTWLMKKHPDILAITKDGPQLYGHRQNMDITHPGYLFHSERVIRRIMEHIMNVSNIIGFQLDNETKSYDTSGERAQQQFLSCLKEQFPDISDFNREFGLDYWSNRVNHWEDFPDVRGTINQSLAGEFKKFQRRLVTNFLSWQADIIREYARPDQFITHNFDYDWIDYSYGYQPEVNQFEAARCVSVAGCDIYHPSQDALTGFEISLCGSITRGLKKDNYLILETQAQGNIEWLPYPGQLLLQAYSHIANGANSVMYWHWHSIHNAVESYWKGILSHDFSRNSIYQEISKIGSQFQLIGDHLKNLKKENKVAILIDNASLTGLSLFPLKEKGDRSYNFVLRTFSSSLYRLNLEFDIISSDERNFSSYECVVVPALYSAPDSLLQSLSDYVKNGGHLIASCKSGFSDAYLKIHSDMQPHILHECLGIHYDQFTIPRKVGLSPSPALLDSQGKSHGEFTLPGCVNAFMELVSCDTASELAAYDHPVWKSYSAVTQNSFGSGTSLYFATLPTDRQVDRIFSYYFKKCSILRDNLPTFPVIIKRGINDYKKELYYYFNYSSDTQKVTHHGNTGTDLLSEQTVKTDSLLVLKPWGFSAIESL